MTIDNVADLLVATLEQAGVQRIFGIVGDSLNGFTEALRSRGKIEWVHVRHEEVAAFAAAGEAQMTGKLAVERRMGDRYIRKRGRPGTRNLDLASMLGEPADH